MMLWSRNVVAVLVLLLVGCTGYGKQHTLSDSSCNSIAKTYFSKPLKQTIQDFTGYALNTQYVIYICGNQHIHPPALYLAAPFASQGKKVVDLLSNKIASGVDDLTVRDILQVFVEMDRQKTYDVRSDEKVIETLTERVRNISDPRWKGYCEDLLRKITL